jgi:hypothetical protein
LFSPRLYHFSIDANYSRHSMMQAV